MSNLYTYELYDEKLVKSHDLLMSAIEHYATEKEITSIDISNLRILKHSTGKPYIPQCPVHFSISHSKNLWMCGISMENIGIDVQIKRKLGYEKIADRMFNRNERHYIKLWGEDGFYGLWARREAVGKLTGKGIFGEKMSLVNENADLIETFIWEGSKFKFEEIEIDSDIKCVVCHEIHEQVEIR